MISLLRSFSAFGKLLTSSDIWSAAAAPEKVGNPALTWEVHSQVSLNPFRQAFESQKTAFFQRRGGVGSPDIQRDRTATAADVHTGTFQQAKPRDHLFRRITGIKLLTYPLLLPSKGKHEDP